MDDVSRADLHARLDKILDDRTQLESPHPPNTLGALLEVQLALQSHPERSNALFHQGVAFLRDVLGQPVRAAGIRRRYKSEAEHREILRSWVEMLWPILHVPPQPIFSLTPQQELSVFEVLDALSALDAGEIRPVFVAKTGKNRRANRWSLARTKLHALAWKKRLVAVGHTEKSASYEVTVAFGEQWDTIRRWKQQCEQILGPDQVAFELRHAGGGNDWYLQEPSGIFGARKPDLMESLKRAGIAYRAELRRSAELSKRKPRMVA